MRSCRSLPGGWRPWLGLASLLLTSAVGAVEESSTFWAFQPVCEVAPPAASDSTAVASPIDHFIAARLAAQGLQIAPQTDRRTLLRRATFDLTGLPPTPAEVASFLADDAPDAFARVVDRLLASPRYGERWGRHWLDIVRYADARDLIQLPAESDFREAWRYRDWVIGAFNRDLPYDQFLRLQIAGDILQPQDSAQIDADALIATGFLAIADFVPGDVDKEQMIADYVNDQIDVVGKACLGLTLACARCHDHKFDPITTADYYALAGIFFSSRLIPGPVKGNTPLVRVPLLSRTELAAIDTEQASDKARLAELTRELATLGTREYRTWLERQATTATAPYLLAAWKYRRTLQSGKTPPVVAADFARDHQLDADLFAHWLEALNEQPAHPALRPILALTDPPTAATAVQELASRLKTVAALRTTAQVGRSPTLALAESVLMEFRADDRRLPQEVSRPVTTWPNRGTGPAAASLVPNTASPVTAQLSVHGELRPVLRFSGNAVLQAEGSVPPIGTLFMVYRPDPAGPAGQRLIGWEDAAVGQHGLGLMTDGAGSVHVIARRNGANADVVLPALAVEEASAGLRLLCITWGPQGVSVSRNGTAAGTNNTLDSLSPDPAITTLQIGGPGSGTAPRFWGDLAELRLYAVPLDDTARQQVTTELTQRWLTSQPSLQPQDEIADLYGELISASSPFRLVGAARERALPADFQPRFTALQNEAESLRKKPPRDIPRAVVVQEGGPADTPHAGFHDARIFLRGNPSKPGDVVPRGVPQIIAGPHPPKIREGSGRRELADWLTDPHHPLTARVLVNRVWQQHFGSGLVRTSANFGALGERPSHPELLDYLAARFVASGWSIKSLHRQIMLSQVYQQQSSAHPEGVRIDPENRLLWRANRRRLESEALRDSLFAVAGRLDLAPGGPAFADVATPRRSVYLQTSRTGAKSADFGPLFDAPDCSGIVERRTESIVAPQALFLMNDPLVTSLAAALAVRIRRDVPEEDLRGRIAHLYEITLGRPPLTEEFEVGLQFLAAARQEKNAESNGLGTPLDPWPAYCRLMVCTNEFLYVD
ncbi:MAG: DUF1549 domain-containing protein [Planctomycetes bacterium]|nr:DUF1549 domain-containing protein [Planctomycetota bacterium]